MAALVAVVVLPMYCRDNLFRLARLRTLKCVYF